MTTRTAAAYEQGVALGLSRKEAWARATEAETRPEGVEAVVQKVMPGHVDGRLVFTEVLVRVHSSTPVAWERDTVVTLLERKGE